MASSCSTLVIADCGGNRNYSSAAWKWKREERRKTSTVAIRCASRSKSGHRNGKKPQANLFTLSSRTSADLPLNEPHGVTFSEYIKDRRRIFKALFSDKSQQLDDEKWRVQMLPITVLFVSVNPVLDLRLTCKSHGRDYPLSVPLNITRILELQVTGWELKGLQGVPIPSYFDLTGRGVMYADGRGSQSRLKWHIEVNVSAVLPPPLSWVPMDVIKSVAVQAATKAMEEIGQEINAGLISDFSKYGREKQASHGQSSWLKSASTASSNGNPRIQNLEPSVH